MKQEKDLSSNALQIAQMVVIGEEDGSRRSAERSKELVMEMVREVYVSAFKKGLKLNEHALIPQLFVLGTDKHTYLIDDMNRLYVDKEKIVNALRLIARQLIIGGEILEFFFHFTEVRAYLTQGPNDPFQEYSKRMGVPFPGTPMTTQFLVVFETPSTYSMGMYDINDTTGELTELKKDNPIHLNDKTTANADSKGKYGGLFTHIVYKPEDAMEIKGGMDIISMKNISMDEYKSKKG